MGDYKIGYVQEAGPAAVGRGRRIVGIPADPLAGRSCSRRGTFDPPHPPPALQDPRYRSRVVLADGGVYDNLGLEPIIKRARTVLASDGGSPFSTEPRPCGFWPLQVVRVLICEDNQVRGLRKRDLIERYQLCIRHSRTRASRSGPRPDTAAIARKGTYWGITTEVANYPTAPGLPCPPEETERLAKLSTRLANTKQRDQENLINWGYAVCDYAIRAYVDKSDPARDQMALSARA